MFLLRRRDAPAPGRGKAAVWGLRNQPQGSARTVVCETQGLVCPLRLRDPLRGRLVAAPKVGGRSDPAGVPRRRRCDPPFRSTNRDRLRGLPSEDGGSGCVAGVHSPGSRDWGGSPSGVSPSPELSMLPALSRALGEERGLNGSAYPITLPLHFMALNVQGLKNLGRPVLLRPGDPVTGVRPACITQRATPSSCRNVRGSDCTTRDCLGMCGGGCECWSWVCGDCCATDGCYWHDIACSGPLSYADPLCIFGAPAAFDCDRLNWSRNPTPSSDGRVGSSCTSPGECEGDLWCLDGTCGSGICSGSSCRGVGPRDCIDGVWAAMQNAGTHVDVLGWCGPGGNEPGNLPAKTQCRCLSYSKPPSDRLAAVVVLAPTTARGTNIRCDSGSGGGRSTKPR